MTHTHDNPWRESETLDDADGFIMMERADALPRQPSRFIVRLVVVFLLPMAGFVLAAFTLILAVGNAGHGSDSSWAGPMFILGTAFFCSKPIAIVNLLLAIYPWHRLWLGFIVSVSATVLIYLGLTFLWFFL